MAKKRKSASLDSGRPTKRRPPSASPPRDVVYLVDSESSQDCDSIITISSCDSDQHISNDSATTTADHHDNSETGSLPDDIKSVHSFHSLNTVYERPDTRLSLSDTESVHSFHSANTVYERPDTGSSLIDIGSVHLQDDDQNGAFDSSDDEKEELKVSDSEEGESDNSDGIDVEYYWSDETVEYDGSNIDYKESVGSDSEEEKSDDSDGEDAESYCSDAENIEADRSDIENGEPESYDSRESESEASIEGMQNTIHQLLTTYLREQLEDLDTQIASIEHEMFLRSRTQNPTNESNCYEESKSSDSGNEK